MEERIGVLEGKVEFLAKKLGRVNSDLVILAIMPESEMANNIRKRYQIIYETERREYEEREARNNDNNVDATEDNGGVLQKPEQDNSGLRVV